MLKRFTLPIISFLWLTPLFASPFLIQNVHVFDGNHLLPNQDVLVISDKIASVKPHTKERHSKAIEIIDGSGSTLLPGLIDAHTHVVAGELQKALMFGVTTELDMGMDVNLAKEIKKHQADNPAAQEADLYTASTLITAPKGHGTQYGVLIPTLTEDMDVQAFVDARIQEGSDYIKVVHEDFTQLGFSVPSLTLAQVSDVIKAAHRRGKKVIAHVGTAKAGATVVELGADGLAHVFVDEPLGADFATLAAEKKIFVAPTLTVLKSLTGASVGSSLLQDPDLSPYLSKADKELLALSMQLPNPSIKFNYATDTVRQLLAKGVPILAGTDAPKAGIVHGISLHRELELLVDSGLTPIQALRSATSVPAQLFDLKNRGTIQPGSLADLVLVKGDPTQTITDTRRIQKIWKRGALVDREAYRQSLAAPVN